MSISRLYNFINNQCGLTISLIEGDALIKDIHKIHNLGPNAIDFYQNTLLSSLQMINFLKPGEHLGFYIDSQDPYFRFKVEMAQTGQLRTLLLPEDFEEVPTQFTGSCRLHKIYPGKSPYTSLLEMTEEKLSDIVNVIITQSYQTNSKVLTNKETNKTLMVTKLPPTNIDKKVEDFDDISLEDFLEDQKSFLEGVLNSDSTELEELVVMLESNHFKYLASKEVKFECPCSKDNMIQNMSVLKQDDIEEIFKDSADIDTRCDYCNTIYKININEITPIQ